MHGGPQNLEKVRVLLWLLSALIFLAYWTRSELIWWTERVTVTMWSPAWCEPAKKRTNMPMLGMQWMEEMPLTERNILSNLLVYAFAGNDITVITLLNLLGQLAANPETRNRRDSLTSIDKYSRDRSTYGSSGHTLTEMADPERMESRS